MLVTPEMRETYTRDGVVKIPALFSQDEVAEVSSYFDELYSEFQDPEAPGVEMFGQAARVLRYDGGIFFDFLCRDIPAFADLIRGSRVAQALMELMELDSITLWRDEFHCKHPTGVRTDAPWHQDIANLPFAGTQFPGVWIPLVDITEETSPLCTIPGTHLDRSLIERPWLADEKDRQMGELSPGYVPSRNYDALVAAGELPCQKWIINAGDALVLHPYVVHGAPRNQSTGRRVAYVTRWLGDDALWRPDKHSIADPQAAEVFEGERPRRDRLMNFERATT